MAPSQTPARQTLAQYSEIFGVKLTSLRACEFQRHFNIQLLQFPKLFQPSLCLLRPQESVTLVQHGLNQGSLPFLSNFQYLADTSKSFRQFLHQATLL